MNVILDIICKDLIQQTLIFVTVIMESPCTVLDPRSVDFYDIRLLVVICIVDLFVVNFWIVDHCIFIVSLSIVNPFILDRWIVVPRVMDFGL